MTNLFSTSIHYSRKVTVIQEDLKTGHNSVFNILKKDLPSFLKNISCFLMRLDNTVLNKVTRLLESLGFEVVIDREWGFEWESRISAKMPTK